MVFLGFPWFSIDFPWVSMVFIGFSGIFWAVEFLCDFDQSKVLSFWAVFSDVFRKRLDFDHF